MKYVNRVLIVVVTILMMAFVATMTANIVLRYFFSYSLVWSEEFARYSFIWVAMLGACIAFIKNEHLGFDLLVAALKPPVSHVVNFANHLLVLSFLVLFGYQGSLLALEAGSTPSQSMGIPMGIVYIVMPLSAAVMTGTLLMSLRSTLRGFRSRPAGPAEAS